MLDFNLNLALFDAIADRVQLHDDENAASVHDGLCLASCCEFRLFSCCHVFTTLAHVLAAEPRALSTIPVPSPTVPLVELKPQKITLSSVLMDREGAPLSLDLRDSDHSDVWDTILCPAVLITRKELLLLVAGRLGTSLNRQGMCRVSRCNWCFGRHVTVTTASGTRLHYWGSGTYERVRRRLDKAWPTWVEVEGHDTSKSGRKTSRLAFVVCGFQLTGVEDAMGVPLPKELHEVADDPDKTKDKNQKDTVTFLLVRYAQAHPSTRKRGPGNRPLCPGPLQNTHCLWTWATRPATVARGCFRPRPWERHRQYFGSTVTEQDRLQNTDRLAWYDIVQVTNVRCYANVQEDTDHNQQPVFLQSMVWC